jgi:hypothetical protein
VTVYTDLLCAVSPYFRKALKGSFTEAQTRSIDLKDVSEYTFHVFLQWMYCQLPQNRSVIVPPGVESLSSSSVPASGDCIRPTAARAEESEADSEADLDMVRPTAESKLQQDSTRSPITPTQSRIGITGTTPNGLRTLGRWCSLFSAFTSLQKSIQYPNYETMS